MATLCVIAWKVTTELQPNADHVSTGIYSELKNEETFMERETALKRQKLSRAGKDQPGTKHSQTGKAGYTTIAPDEFNHWTGHIVDCDSTVSLRAAAWQGRWTTLLEDTRGAKIL